MSVAPAVTVVIEWENVLLSDPARATRMLAALERQAAALGRAVEVLLVFSGAAVPRDAIDRLLPPARGNGAAAVTWRPVEIAAGHYYELKNEGAVHARGEIVVFLDSDVVPEEGWLSAIAHPFFENPQIDVLAGETHVAHASLVEKSFALGWFFPLRNPQSVLRADAAGFFANNVAFRRSVILRHPFPPLPEGATRGACSALAQSLSGAGVRIWTNTGARVQHPPPSNLRHFLVRAMAHGRDLVVRETASGHSALQALGRGLRWSASLALRAVGRIGSRRTEVGLPAWQVPVAAGIMTGFYGIAFLAACVTILAPGYAARNWRI